MFVPKRVGLTYIHVLVGKLGEIFMYYGLPLDSIHVLLHEFMPYTGTLKL